ncbi:MAG: hypothetical protein LBI29_00120 [Rickettsiales bacterium]|jgi:hypothetical protein|nr:hypothetical protein [Rickettsiales bacterium]
MFLFTLAGTVIVVFTILAVVYGKGQKDGEKTLITEQIKNRRRYKKVKDLRKIKDKLREGKF